MAGRGYGAGTRAVLTAVTANGAMSIAGLAACTSRDDGAVRRSVDRLEADGLVRRRAQVTPCGLVEVRDFVPCNNHPRKRCRHCLAGASRYLNGRTGRKGRLPASFETDSPRLAERLDRARDIGTYGVHVVTAVKPVKRRGRGCTPQIVVDLEYKRELAPKGAGQTPYKSPKVRRKSS